MHIQLLNRLPYSHTATNTLTAMPPTTTNTSATDGLRSISPNYYGQLSSSSKHHYNSVGQPQHFHHPGALSPTLQQQQQQKQLHENNLPPPPPPPTYRPNPKLTANSVPRPYPGSPLARTAATAIGVGMTGGGGSSGFQAYNNDMNTINTGVGNRTTAITTSTTATTDTTSKQTINRQQNEQSAQQQQQPIISPTYSSSNNYQKSFTTTYNNNSPQQQTTINTPTTSNDQQQQQPTTPNVSTSSTTQQQQQQDGYQNYEGFTSRYETRNFDKTINSSSNLGGENNTDPLDSSFSQLSLDTSGGRLSLLDQGSERLTSMTQRVLERKTYTTSMESRSEKKTETHSFRME